MKLFWLLPLLLFLAQLLFTLVSTSQIRYEELAESARNPFWMQSRLVYDRVSTSVWWYLTQMGVYNVFGYDIFTTKITRLVLHLISLFALAALLRRFLGEKKALLPLAVIGLSPTLLFLNTLQTSYGTDLQYLPIVLFLVTCRRLFLRLFGVALAMIAWLSYPPFVFYLPALIFLGVLPLRTPIRRTPKASVRSMGAPRSASPLRKNTLAELSLALFFFLLPLIFAYLYIENRSTFVSGVFRGGGGSLGFDNISTHLPVIISDFFEKGTSYHFEIASAEFSHFYPILTFLFVLWAGFKLKLPKSLKLLIALAFLTLFLALGATGLSVGLPGMRRYTPALAAFYALFVIVWWHISKTPKLKDSKTQIAKVLLLALLVHHVIVYPINLSHLKDPSPYAERIFFDNDPRGKLVQMVSIAQKEELKLACVDGQGQQFFCRYNEVWAAVAGYCFWNKLNCNTIYGFDIQSNKFIPLSVEYKDEYY